MGLGCLAPKVRNLSTDVPCAKHVLRKRLGVCHVRRTWTGFPGVASGTSPCKIWECHPEAKPLVC